MYEKYEILMGLIPDVENKLNNLNKIYETTICSATHDNKKGLIVIVGLYPRTITEKFKIE